MDDVRRDVVVAQQRATLGAELADQLAVLAQHAQRYGKLELANAVDRRQVARQIVRTGPDDKRADAEQDKQAQRREGDPAFHGSPAPTETLGAANWFEMFTSASDSCQKYLVLRRKTFPL